MDIFSNIPLLYTLLFCSTLIFSIFINGLFLNFSQNLGIRKNQQVQIRWSPSAKPALGGISFYIVFLIGFIFLELLNEGTHSYLASRKIVGLLFAVTMAFLMGLADDAFDTKPLVKFAVQCLCAVVLISTGTKINTFNSEFLNYFLTLIWVVGIMNSINLLDNMDSIATIVSISICSFSLFQNMNFKMATHPEALITLIVIGTLCGFLVYNWHPAKIFMGDTGSQFLGVFLAFIGIHSCWNLQLPPQQNEQPTLAFTNMVLVALVYVMPLIDTFVVVLNRVIHGNSPFVGGRDHTTHTLFFIGMTEKRIALLFFFINICGGLLACFLLSDISSGIGRTISVALYPLALFFFLFFLTLRKNKR